MKCITSRKCGFCGLNINGVWDFLADLKEKLASTVQGNPKLVTSLGISTIKGFWENSHWRVVPCTMKCDKYADVLAVLFFSIRKAGLETGGGEGGAEGSQQPQVLLSSK